MLTALLGVAIAIAGFITWFGLGVLIAAPISKIRQFDEWRYETSNHKFNRKFDPSSECDFGAALFWPVGIFMLIYHLCVVDWDKDQRRMWREIKKDEKIVADSKKQEALHILWKNHENNREKRLREMEEKAGINKA